VFLPGLLALPQITVSKSQLSDQLLLSRQSSPVAYAGSRSSRTYDNGRHVDARSTYNGLVNTSAGTGQVL